MFRVLTVLHFFPVLNDNTYPLVCLLKTHSLMLKYTQFPTCNRVKVGPSHCNACWVKCSWVSTISMARRVSIFPASCHYITHSLHCLVHSTGRPLKYTGHKYNKISTTLHRISLNYTAQLFQTTATVATSWWASSFLIKYTKDKSPQLELEGANHVS